MLRANSIFQQALKSGVRSCLELLAQVDKCLFSNSKGTERATVGPRNVQALVTRFSLTGKRPRGAALAGPCAHAAMCVLARACVCFSFSLSVETWLVTTQSVRDDMSAALISTFEKIFCSFKVSQHGQWRQSSRDGRSLSALNKKKRSSKRALHRAHSPRSQGQVRPLNLCRSCA